MTTILTQLASSAVAQDNGQLYDTGFCGPTWLAQVVAEMKAAKFVSRRGTNITTYGLAKGGVFRSFSFAPVDGGQFRFVYTETPCHDFENPAPALLTPVKDVTPTVLCEVCEEVTKECTCAKPKAETVNVKRYMGSTDERTTCDLCGKTGLKRTFCFDVEGVFMFVGSDCARINFGIVKVEQLQEQLTDAREAARKEFFRNHPVSVAIKAERAAYQADHGGFLTGALQSGHIARWTEMSTPLQAEWESLEKTLTFSIDCPELRVPEATQKPEPAKSTAILPTRTGPRVNTIDAWYQWKPQPKAKKATAQPLFEARLF